MLGSERKSAVVTPEVRALAVVYKDRRADVTAQSRRRTAFHEAGHAIMALFTSGADPLHKVTGASARLGLSSASTNLDAVVPRGHALGIVRAIKRSVSAC